MRIPPSLSLAFLVACTSTPVMPEGEGPGLLAADPSPPEGARTWNAPDWRVGDTFTLLGGAQFKMKFVVTEATDNGYTLTDERGIRLRRGKDLANFGEWPKEGDAAMHVLAPADLRYHWPLWVGKRWRCGFVDKMFGGQAIPIEAAYEVEGVDSIRTAGGNFQALRILRTVRRKGDEGPFYDRTALIWYCPDVGYEVRQVLSETAVELLEWKQVPR
jgi:hypothetical protein